MNIYCLDESRFGLLSRLRSVLTSKGVKPVVSYQHRFENFYLFGAFAPSTGSSFLLELPSCTTAGFQLFLNLFSRQNPNEFKISILDKGAFHHSKAVVVPANRALLFLPPYSPELNPAEKIGRHLKDALGNNLFKSLNELSDELQHLIQKLLLPEDISSLTAFDYYVNAFITNFKL